jgi:prepilin-type N-terminal cleavage/methylation domain-containing protein
MKRMNKKGVTLIELVVVFAIIAIGAVLLAPNIGAWLPNYRLRSATRDIVSTMRTAQMKAVSMNTEYRVDFNVAGESYIIRYQTTAGLKDDGVGQVLPSGVTFVNANFSGGVSYAIFNSNSTASSGSVVLKNTKGSQKKITLTSSTGRVKIE